MILRVPGRAAHISIHAPVKGATSQLAEGMYTMEISIHAPVKGATVIPSTLED